MNHEHFHCNQLLNTFHIPLYGVCLFVGDVSDCVTNYVNQHIPNLCGIYGTNDRTPPMMFKLLHTVKKFSYLFIFNLFSQ